MTDLSAIRVIPFYGKGDEWPTWSEKFLAKAKHYGFKDVLLGKVTIPKTDEVFNVESEEGKKKMMTADLNELAYTELILSIDDKTSSGKVAFNLVKACKNKDYVDGNAFMAWERLKNKFEPVSAPSLVKMEKQFRQCALKKNQDPEIWITELEDLRMKLEELGSSISDNQFMIHILNNMTSDYDLQLAMMEKRINDKMNPLTIDEIRADLNLRFERLNMELSDDNENEGVEDLALFGGQFKGKCRNCGAIGHKAQDCKNKTQQNGTNHGNSQNGAYCTYCRRSGHLKRNCFKLKNKMNRNHSTSSNHGNYGNQPKNFDSTDVAFMSITKQINLPSDIWICDSGACGRYCRFMEGLMIVRDINEEITIGNGHTMVATKIGDLKYEVNQINGSKFDVMLKEVKYVPELWVNLFSINKALKN